MTTALVRIRRAKRRPHDAVAIPPCLLYRWRMADRRSVLVTFEFLGISLAGALAMGLVCALAPPAAQLAVLGSLVSILAGILVGYIRQDGERERRRGQLLAKLAVPVALARDHDLFDQYDRFCNITTNVASQSDSILREVALLKIAAALAQIETLADGAAVFHGTEAWRTAYGKLLRSPGLRRYRSVAWVRHADYWRDAPGEQSMEVNFEASFRGVRIERVVILRDELWPRAAALPDDSVRPWIGRQHDHGLRVSLVRESDLAAEPDLLADVGIYGDRAVGVLEVDDRARTQRFTLSFDGDAVKLALERWERLVVFAVDYGVLLDAAAGDL